MGMYTELHLNAGLKKISKKRAGLITEEILKITGDSYYFSADTKNTLRFDKLINRHYLCIRTNIKNYHSELESFIDYITPYLDKGDGEFLGFKRYEEDQQPTLIYHPNNFIRYK